MSSDQRAASSVVCMEMCLYFFVLSIFLQFVLNEKGGGEAPNTRVLIFATPSSMSMSMLELRSRQRPAALVVVVFVFSF